MGEVTVGYLGPSCDDSLGVAAVSVLLTYLCGGPISVLENTLVEREQLCSGIYYELETRPDTAIWFDLTAVETERLKEAYERMISVLKEVIDKPLDMSYMLDCLKRERRQIKERAETSEDFFTQSIIEDHCFSDRDGRTLKDLENLNELDTLESWSESQWKELISKVFVNNHHVCVLGEPSSALATKLADDDKARAVVVLMNFTEVGLGTGKASSMESGIGL
jgi:Zn-dependent M16 (insulinase) family peptidase